MKIPLFQTRHLRPSSALSTQWVWSLFQCCGGSTSKWASAFNSKRQENILDKLVSLCQTFGNVALVIGCHVPAASSGTHKLCSLRTLGSLWSRKTSYNWNSLWGALGRWLKCQFGIWSQSRKGSRQKNSSTTIGTNDERMDKGGSTH